VSLVETLLLSLIFSLGGFEKWGVSTLGNVRWEGARPVDTRPGPRFSLLH